MKIIILSIILIFYQNSVLAEKNISSKYENYLFSPKYEHRFDEKALKKNILIDFNNSYKIDTYDNDWYEVTKLYAVPLHNDKYLVLNKIEVRDSKTKEISRFLDHKIYVLKEDNPKLPSAQDSIVLIGQDGLSEHIAKSYKYDDTLIAHNIDVRANKFYGCIEKEPAFLVSLIQGLPDFAFLITGAGRSSGVDHDNFDNISLRLFTPSGEMLFKESLVINNFYAVAIRNKHHSETHTPQNRVADKSFSEFPIDDEFGRTKYSKMFVNDLDQDGFLEILFWNRVYKSPPFISELGAKAKGFIFEKQSFILYKENNNSFSKIEVSNSKAESLLRKNDLSWDVGYPREGELCGSLETALPILWGADGFE